MQRTLVEQTPTLVGQQIFLQGWVDTVRDHGKITFIDLRDRSGLVQAVISTKAKLSAEDVVELVGVVKKRPDNLINKNLSTGEIEIEVEKITILNEAAPLPFPINTDGYDIDEEVRLKYRYLDMRRARLQKNLRIRSQYVKAARQYLYSQGFCEVETPLLTKSTPEGSRDFVVPSRLQPGKFFALPQSPQQYKQLLMVGGIERYFQLARCLRDEDLRSDRGFEHTQIDLEMSFVSKEDVMNLVESMTIYALEEIGVKIKQKPFPVITYQEAMDKYGADKFDMRTPEEKEQGVLAFAWVVDFPFFEPTDDGGWTFTHNPFSMPKAEHIPWLMEKKNIDQIVTNQYDLVCNGYEVSGGSIRAHKKEILEAVFEVMGYSKDQIYTQFGHMLEAFSYGAPPHGGCAQGLERLLMVYLGEDYIREIQAFPQTGRGRTSVMDAPSTLSPEQLAELGLSVNTNQSTTSATVLERISKRLKDLKIDHKLTTHEPVFTSEQAAQVRGVDLHTGAKALIMKADGKAIMAVVAADTKVDTGKLKKLIGVKDVCMASKEEVEKLTSLTVGAVPPFGSLFKLTTYVDSKLLDNKQINFNAGRHDTSITLNSSDYLRFEDPQVIECAK